MESITEKGKPCLIFQNNRFRLVYKGLESTTWRCTKKACKAQIHTLPSGEVKELTVTHNHDDKVLNIQLDKLKAQCKRKAVDQIDSRPAKVMREALSSLDNTHSITTSDLKNCRLMMYREKRKTLPTLPKTMAQCVQKVSDVPLQTGRGENFLLDSRMTDKINGIITYTCDSNLRRLCAADTILGDGTFYVAPKQFHQLYTIHAFLNMIYVPLVFCLLPDKATATYELMLNIIVNRCAELNVSFRPTTVLLDFEMAAHNAFRRVLQGIKIMGCRFHYAQAVFRKIATLGLKPLYTDSKSQTGYWLKKFLRSQCCRQNK